MIRNWKAEKRDALGRIYTAGSKKKRTSFRLTANAARDLYKKTRRKRRGKKIKGRWKKADETGIGDRGKGGMTLPSRKKKSAVAGTRQSSPKSVYFRKTKTGERRGGDVRGKSGVKYLGEWTKSTVLPGMGIDPKE